MFFISPQASKTFVVDAKHRSSDVSVEPTLLHRERFLHLSSNLVSRRESDSNANSNSFLDEDGEDS